MTTPSATSGIVGLMLHIILLAFAAAVYPTLLAGVLIILTRPNPAGQLVSFLIGGMAMSLTAGLVILAGLEQSGQFDQPSQPGNPAVDLTLGVLSLGAAYALATGRPRRVADALARRRERRPEPAEPAGPSRTDRVLSRGSRPLTIALGAILNLPGVWYLAALKEISIGDYSTAASIGLILLFNTIMFLLVELPLLAYLLSPERAVESVGGFNAWLGTHKRQVAMWVTLVVGIYLIAKGLVAAL